MDIKIKNIALSNYRVRCNGKNHKSVEDYSIRARCFVCHKAVNVFPNQNNRVGNSQVCWSDTHTCEEAKMYKAYAILAGCPVVGTIVEVVRGRKVKLGTIAEVVWMNESKDLYGVDEVSGRIGIKVDDEIVFIDSKNVEVTLECKQEWNSLLQKWKKEEQERMFGVN
jgi:hypothetical protein